MCQLAKMRTAILQSYTTSPLCCILYSLPAILTRILLYDPICTRTSLLPKPKTIFARINELFQQGLSLNRNLAIQPSLAQFS